MALDTNDLIAIGEELVRLREDSAKFRAVLEQIAAEPLRRCNGYTRCTDHMASPHVVDVARKALGMEPAHRPERAN